MMNVKKTGVICIHTALIKGGVCLSCAKFKIWQDRYTI